MMNLTYPTSSFQRGYSLLEVSLSIMVVGVFVAAASVGLGGLTGAQALAQRGEQIIDVDSSITNFALLNHRLPCVDTDRDGYENCGSVNSKVGGLPYLSLALNASPDDVDIDQIIYGTYKQIDLTSHAELTSDQINEQAYLDRNDFRQALILAANQTFSPLHIHTTGDNERFGSENCATNRSQNVAYIIIHGGADDLTGDGSKFDGENANFITSGGAPCFSAPTRKTDLKYDDSVVLMGFETLLGRMTMARR